MHYLNQGGYFVTTIQSLTLLILSLIKVNINHTSKADSYVYF
jgi:hypothetical protein